LIFPFSTSGSPNLNNPLMASLFWERKQLHLDAFSFSVASPPFFTTPATIPLPPIPTARRPTSLNFQLGNCSVPFGSQCAYSSWSGEAFPPGFFFGGVAFLDIHHPLQSFDVPRPSSIPFFPPFRLGPKLEKQSDPRPTRHASARIRTPRDFSSPTIATRLNPTPETDDIFFLHTPAPVPSPYKPPSSGV